MRMVRTSPSRQLHQTICLKCADLQISDRFPAECARCEAPSAWLVTPPDSRDRLHEMTRRIRRHCRTMEAAAFAAEMELLESKRGIGARGPSSGATPLSRVALVSQEPRAPMPPEAG